ncbi:MAG: ATP-binding protein [Eubacteriales bacterium]|nr:ATP-binding protein [Eubacteriales bacterium]MDD3349773.1 ATP-binding protein [Eubacteriales bacterium]
MLETAAGLIRFASSLVFGVAVSVLFAGISPERKNRIVVVSVCIVLLISQSAFWWFLGIEMTSKLYPLIIHVPMILLFSLYFKRPWLISVASVLSAYLCCQAPRWVGFLAGAAFGARVADHIFYISAVFLSYYFLKRYVAASIRELMEQSVPSRILLGAVPFFYYAFDYVTTIYTDVLYQGTKWAVQFMPSTVSVFYFVFVILYYAETQKQSAARRERDMLTAQLQLAKTEFSTLRRLQECTGVYRHDMRHHFAFLQSMAASGNLEGIQEYLKTAQSDIDTITPVRFCENETANLILSAFSNKATQTGVILSVDAKLPASIPLSDTEFCSLLSNSLENSITAAASCSDPQTKTVAFKAQIHKNKLLVSTDNSYAGEIRMKAGLPQSALEGHGYGTRSIVSIAEEHGGQVIFSAEDGVFRVKIMLPLQELNSQRGNGNYHSS